MHALPIWNGSSMLAVAVVVEAVAGLGHVLDVLERRRVRADPAARPMHFGGHAGADAHVAAGDRGRPSGCRRRCRRSRCPEPSQISTPPLVFWQAVSQPGTVGIAVVEAGEAGTLHADAVHAGAGGERERAGDVAAAAIRGSLMKLKPSSTMPSQSLSRPSQASTPALVFTHSQPFAGFLVGVVEVGEAGRAGTCPATHDGSELGTRQELKQVPQFEMSVCRSGELLLHSDAAAGAARCPPPPPVPPLPPGRRDAPLPPRSPPGRCAARAAAHRRATVRNRNASDDPRRAAINWDAGFQSGHGSPIRSFATANRDD